MSDNFELRASTRVLVGDSSQISIGIAGPYSRVHVGNRHDHASVSMTSGATNGHGAVLEIRDPNGDAAVRLTDKGLELPDETAAEGRRLITWKQVLYGVTYMMRSPRDPLLDVHPDDPAFGPLPFVGGDDDVHPLSWAGRHFSAMIDRERDAEAAPAPGDVPGTLTDGLLTVAEEDRVLEQIKATGRWSSQKYIGTPKPSSFVEAWQRACQDAQERFEAVVRVPNARFNEYVEDLKRAYRPVTSRASCLGNACCAPAADPFATFTTDTNR